MPEEEFLTISLAKLAEDIVIAGREYELADVPVLADVNGTVYPVIHCAIVTRPGSDEVGFGIMLGLDTVGESMYDGMPD